MCFHNSDWKCLLLSKHDSAGLGLHQNMFIDVSFFNDFTVSEENGLW